MKIGRLVYIVMPAAIVLSFMWAPAADVLGETSRIIYYHVPMAWVSALAFIVSGIAAIAYLYKKESAKESLEAAFNNSAEIGLVFTVFTTATGSIWAKLMWGTYWNWDPRETSIIILLLIYTAYFSLRSALERNPGRGRISAAYLIFAMTVSPFFIFVIPRVYASLHPDPIINPGMKMQLDATMRITLLVSTTAFTLLYVYLLSIRNRLSRLRARREESIHAT
jgi:heme exporter protein C